MFPHKNCPMFLSCRSLFFFSSSLLCGLELIYYRAETWQRSRHNNLKNVHTKIQWWVSWFILSQSLPENSVLRNGAQLMHKWACNPVYFIFWGKKKIKGFWHFSCYRHSPDYEQKPETSFKKAMFLHSCFQQRITLYKNLDIFALYYVLFFFFSPLRKPGFPRSLASLQWLDRFYACIQEVFRLSN